MKTQNLAKASTITALFLAMLSPLAPSTALSHEGHDHDAPGLVQAPRGGDIRSLEELHVEVLT
ncbi:MAG: hypothetical protein RBT63_04405, partial [Bdellovibrionales bacterium]|nr:hypothetical protein [Bdellovibrionales bacterium]